MKTKKSKSKKIRRNSVVIFKKRDMYTFYQRVVKTFPNGDFLTLCSGLHFRRVTTKDVQITSYTGYTNSKGRFIPMTSLRRLKKQAQRYHGKNAHNTPFDYEFISQGTK